MSRILLSFVDVLWRFLEELSQKMSRPGVLGQLGFLDVMVRCRCNQLNSNFPLGSRTYGCTINSSYTKDQLIELFYVHICSVDKQQAHRLIQV